MIASYVHLTSQDMEQWNIKETFCCDWSFSILDSIIKLHNLWYEYYSVQLSIEGWYISFVYSPWTILGRMLLVEIRVWNDL